MTRLIFTLLLLSFMPLTAMAGTVTQFDRVQNGVFDKATLVGFNTYAMRVTADTDWTNSDMEIDLSKGTFNHISTVPPFGGMASIPGVTGIGDTAVFGPTKELGSGFHAVGNPPQLATDHSESPTSFIASWFNTATDDIGVFDIGMITISDDAEGELRFRTISGREVEEGGYTLGTAPTWTIRRGAIVRVPEPGSGGVVALSALFCLGGRRRLYLTEEM